VGAPRRISVAALPLVAIGAVEKMAFKHFVCGRHVNESRERQAQPARRRYSPMDSMTHFSLGHFLASPGLWIGLALTAAFLAAGPHTQVSGPI